MTIVVVEDMPMFREMIVRVCVSFGHDVVGETDRGDRALSLCRETAPDVLLLDMRLPDMNGFSVVSLLRTAHSSTRIIALTAYASDMFFYQLEQMNLDGYVDKSSETSSAIKEALTAVAQGRRWFSPTYQTARLHRALDPCAFSKLLTPTEKTVLGLIGNAHSDAEIAAQLGISARTAQTHRSNILKKLNIESTPKLVIYARSKGFAVDWS